MNVIKYKILLVKIIALFATHIESIKIKIAKLSAGDIVDINYVNSESTETYSRIFAGNNTPYFIELEGSSNAKQISVEKEVCLAFDDLAFYYYPEIIIDDIKSALSSKIYNYTNQDNLFNFDPKYLNDKHSFGIVKKCRIVKIQQLFIQVLTQADFPIISDFMNYKLLLDKTAVLRFGQKHETHYVSSISTGECLIQAYVNTAEWCNQNYDLQEDIKNERFFNSSQYISRVKIIAGNPDREEKMNNYMEMFEMNLVHLSGRAIKGLSGNSFYIKFKSIDQPSVVELHLRSFPPLPERQPPLSITSQKFVADVLPGDVINLDDLKQIYSFISVDNFLVDVSDGITEPSIYFNYTDCRKLSEDDAVKIEYSIYRLYPKHFTESFYKFDYFEEVIRRKNYGVDKQYLNDRYKCMKVKICSGFERTKLIIPSVYVVNLDKNDIDRVRVFDGKNVVLRYKVDNETHYVARTEKGNCLFQALIYENLEDSSNNQKIPSPLLFKGKILSANSNQNLEKWAEKYVSDLPINGHKTLMSLIYNQGVKETVFYKLFHEYSSNTMINIYLDKLH